MLLLSHIFAFLGALVLFAAGVAWWKIVKYPEKSGAKIELEPARLRPAAASTGIAFILCAIAAILAVVDWFVR